jgi:hypothetical protein
MPAGDRVRERRKAAALARHYRDEEGLSIAEIARRLGRAEASVKAYLYDRRMLTKGSAGNGWPRREVARSGVTCRRRQHEGRSSPGGSLSALDWAVQHVR